MSKELLIAAKILINTITACATGTGKTEKADEENYEKTRTMLLRDPNTKKLLPEYIETCRTAAQFWQFIKYDHGDYHERREFIWNSFSKLISSLENDAPVPLDADITRTIAESAESYVNDQWNKALERRHTDPEGAITTARSLIETVCKHILEKSGVSCDKTYDINKLYSLTARQLNLSPQDHEEEVFKKILGSCMGIVEGLGSLRNSIGDAHGKTSRHIKPNERHAELAVNLAGSVSSFLIKTYEKNKADRKTAIPRQL